MCRQKHRRSQFVIIMLHVSSPNSPPGMKISLQIKWIDFILTPRTFWNSAIVIFASCFPVSVCSCASAIKIHLSAISPLSFNRLSMWLLSRCNMALLKMNPETMPQSNILGSMVASFPSNMEWSVCLRRVCILKNGDSCLWAWPTFGKGFCPSNHATCLFHRRLYAGWKAGRTKSVNWKYRNAYEIFE